MALSTLAQSALGDIYSIFQEPPMRARPMFRWWWPDGLVDPDEIREEVRQMYDAGFGGAEISDVHRSRSERIDLEEFGWGTEPWVDGLYAASHEAEELGFYIDNTVGPTYPAAVPGLSQDDPAALREVVLGRVVLTGGEGYDGPVPPPGHAPEGTVTKETLLAVHAYKVDSSSSPTANPIILDHESLLSLSCLVRNGTIKFSPPDNSTWMLLSWHERGSGMTAKGGPHNHEDGAVIDHFSELGSRAVTDFWDDHILSPELKDLLSSIGGAFFEDSIELEYNTLWSGNLREEFRERQGYDLFRYLPAITQDDQKHVFRFADTELNRGVVNDFWDTLGQMYIDYHVNVIQPWAHDMNMKYRAQVYGVPTDSMSAVARVDIPEGESLGFKNMGDWRALAGAAAFSNTTMISNENGAFLGLSYQLTWDNLIKETNAIMTAGINLQVFHGFSYKKAPGAKWPGFAAFTPYGGDRVGYSESWGPRIPLWKHTREVADYFSRTQALLQRGHPKHDVAFLSPKGYIAAGFSGPYFSADGARDGWSMQLIGPYQLQEPTAFVEDSRLHPNGPGYSVLAFEGDSFASRAPVLPLDAAEKVLEFAKQGLNVMAIGNWSAPRALGFGESSENARIKEIFDELFTLPNVYNPPSREDMASFVPQMEAKPRVQFEEKTQLLSHHRVDGDADHFFFTATHTDTYQVRPNLRITAVEADVLIPRRNAKGVPFWMDLWTGDVTPLAAYEEVSDTQIRVHLSLAAYQSAMITIMPVDDSIPAHATSNPEDARVLRTEKGLVVRTRKSGTYSTSLNGGEDATAEVKNVPSTATLGPWTLDVEDWQPTENLLSTDTVIVNHSITLETLTPWTEIEGLEDVAGIGRYTTTVELPEDWDDKASGAVLAIPAFVGSLRVYVNGEWTGPRDPHAPEHDLQGLLKGGENEIVLELATNLINRIRKVDPAVYESTGRQNYGLVGEIELRPYTDVKIAA